MPPLPIVVPAGEVVLFQVAHFDAQARTAWSVVLVGRSTEYGSGLHGHLSAYPPLALPLASAGIFGSTLSTAPSAKVAQLS